MKRLEKFIGAALKEPTYILEPNIPILAYTPLDLSETNTALKHIDISDPTRCQQYIDKVLEEHNAQVAYGGYLEKRNLYAQNTHFKSTQVARNIHLGIDFWAKAGTKIYTPLAGKIHSFANNANKGNYGPTIVLEHNLENLTFYSLYGHLSIASIEKLYTGKVFEAGTFLATLGTPDINVNYAPHLHFQLIRDIEKYKGDYPGVCAESDLDFYAKNCPNPNLLLKI